MVRSGANYPKSTLSKGCNIQEFSVGDTSVGDGLTLHQSLSAVKGLSAPLVILFPLKVHKREIFYGSDFDIFTFL
jgi:hypothetical protein